MTVDDYSSGLNVRRHQNKLGTAMATAGTGGPRRRQPTRGSGACRAGSFLVDLRRLRFCNSYIGCPEHLNPLQQFVLTCAMLLAALLAQSSIPGQPRSPCDHKPAGGFTPPGHTFTDNLLMICGFLTARAGAHATTIVYIDLLCGVSVRFNVLGTSQLVQITAMLVHFNASAYIRAATHAICLFEPPPKTLVTMPGRQRPEI